jgi:hypothetical protein
MRAVQYFFLYVSLFLLLAHSLVPHVHEPEEEASHSQVADSKQPRDMLEWLAIVFQQDLGEDHLEIYQPVFKYLADSLYPHFNDGQVVSLNRLSFCLLQDFDYLPYQAPYYIIHLRSSIGSRGPPSV